MAIYELPEKIEELIIGEILKYPSLYHSHLHVLEHIVLGYGTGYEWKNGKLNYYLPDRKDKDNEDKNLISRKWAERIFKYGYQNCLPNFSHFSEQHSPLFRIPLDITNDWLHVLKHLVFEINKIDERDQQVSIFAYHVRLYGLKNPHTYIGYDRDFSEFKKLRILTNKLAHDWGDDWMSVDSLHDKKKQEKRNSAASKIFNKIFKDMEAKVKRSYESISLRDAKEYVRRYGADVFKKAIEETEAEKIENPAESA